MTYQIRVSQSDSLAHYGIKGQQWGIRRFQNEDGTLTEEGKARYYDSLSDKQKKLYDKFSAKDQTLIEKKWEKERASLKLLGKQQIIEKLLTI